MRCLHEKNSQALKNGELSVCNSAVDSTPNHGELMVRNSAVNYSSQIASDIATVETCVCACMHAAGCASNQVLMSA